MLKGSSSLQLKPFGLLGHIWARKLKVRLSELRVERARCSPRLCCCTPALPEGWEQDWNLLEMGHTVFWILCGRTASVLLRPGQTMLASVHVGLSFCAQECSLAEFILLIQLRTSVFPALNFSSLFLKEAEVLSKVPNTQNHLPLAHLVQGMQIMDWDNNYVQNK